MSKSTLLAICPTYVCDESLQNPDFPGVLLVFFQCTCGQRHMHGWGKDEPYDVPQHRWAHCGDVFPVFKSARYKSKVAAVKMNREHGYMIVLRKPHA